MTQNSAPIADGILARFSSDLADAVERAARSVVRVDDGSRLTATGVVWDASGVIVTTSHGVERDEELAIETVDGTRLDATLVGRDNDTDLAVLRVESAAGLTPATLAAPEGARVGSLVLALARPGQRGLSATVGIVSARQESQTAGTPEYILSTDAVLYPGFSGGPLADVAGNVVGIVNRVFGRGAGIALGTPLVARVAQTLLAHGRVPRAYLGVRTQRVELPAALRQTLALAQERALLIVTVEPGSAAERGGLLLGDTLLAINGQTVEDVDQLRPHLQNGQTLALRILRGGELRELTTTLGTPAGAEGDGGAA